MPGAEEGAVPCPICEGRGWVVDDDGRAGSARACECRRRGDAPRWIEEAGIPGRYLACSLDNFKTDNPDPAMAEQLLRARSLCRRFCDSFLRDDGGFRDSGLLLIGPPGVGKTHLAAAVLVELIQRYGVRGRFVDWNSLIFEIQSTFDRDSDESKNAVLAPVVSAEVLVLDELGAQKPTAWVNDILYYVINTRYTRRRPTLFTTNYRLESTSRPVSLDGEAQSQSVEGLDRRIPASLLSRLHEMAVPLEIRAEDYRREIKAHRTRV